MADQGKNKRTNNRRKKNNNKVSAGRKGEDLRKGYATEDRDIQLDQRRYDRSSSNDPAWYAHNPQLLRDYASLPFGYPVGRTIQVNGLTDANAYNVPGIMTFEYTPYFSTYGSENASVNVAMRNIYSYVRHANSGHSNYDAPDLMIYLLAMDSIYMMHSWMKRLLGIAMTASPTNRYYPQAMIIANRVDYNDLIENMADFRGFVNQYAIKMGSMCVPASMSYMARHSWMTEGYYVDSPSAKAQTYMFVPRYYMQAVLNADTSIMELQAKDVITLSGSTMTSMKVADIMKAANALLTAVLTNEDFNIMSGDILKAFGDSGVVKVSGVGEGYMVLPIYSQEVLSQIENMTILGARSTFAVSQNTNVGTGNIVNVPLTGSDHQFTSAGYSTAAMATAHINTSNRFLHGEKILNMHHDNVTPEDVIVATRLMLDCTAIALTQSNGFGYDVVSAGSEVVNYAYMWFYTSNNSTLTFTELQSIYDCTPAWSVPQVMRIVAKTNQFDWCPAFYFVTAGTDTYLDWIPMDVDNYAIVSPTNIRNMHDLATLSEFSVPQMGKFSEK